MIAKLVAALVSAALISPPRSDGPFREIEFSAACSAAEAESKVVFVDFFTTWCGPCKQLDATTWKDERVVAWLAEHTVPIKLDAEIATELATRYAVRVYPTLLFVAPDGTERGRIQGYRDAEAFIEQATDALAGIRASDRVREKLTTSPEDVELRQELADALAAEGRFEEALAEYLWLYDVGMRNAPSYSGVRNSFLLSDIADLGKLYPAAHEALTERAATARKRLLEDEQVFQDAMDFSSISGHLRRSEDVLALWDELAARERLTPLVQRALFDEVVDLLLAARRWSDVVLAAGDPLERFDRRMQIYAASKEFAKDEPDLERQMRRSAVDEGTKLWKALLAIGDERAAVLEDRLVAFDPSADTFAELFGGALEVDRPADAERLRAQALAALDEEGRKDFERSAKRRERRAERAKTE